jgi:hypothetical protein
MKSQLKAANTYPIIIVPVFFHIAAYIDKNLLKKPIYQYDKG